MNEHEFPLMATLVTNAVIQREQSKFMESNNLGDITISMLHQK